MLDFLNPLFVGLFLDVFVFSVAGGKRLSARRCIGVENSYVKEGAFKVTSPKATCDNSCLAPSSIVPESASPVIGCKVGPMHTSWQTSDSRFAVRSLTLLCQLVGKPPLGLDWACSTEKLVPQVHVVGAASEGCQPYLRAMASLKAPL